jgi:hypothetical protein
LYKWCHDAAIEWVTATAVVALTIVHHTKPGKYKN